MTTSSREERLDSALYTRFQKGKEQTISLGNSKSLYKSSRSRAEVEI